MGARSAQETKVLRRLIRPLLAPTDPADAMTAYYALEHDARRVRLSLHRTPAGVADGFVAVCQTGHDLFVPLVVMRCRPEHVAELLQSALVPGRPCAVVTCAALRDPIEEALVVERRRITIVHSLDLDRYRPVINVMVEPGQAAFRQEIRVSGEVVAAAGVNWQTEQMAEMYVYTEADYRGRGWGKAVAAACVRDLLSAGRLPLYAAAESNEASLSLARSLGFRDTGVREYECQGALGSRGPAAQS